MYGLFSSFNRTACVVSPPLGWSHLSYFLITWSPSGDTGGPSIVFEAGDMPCPGSFHCFHSVIKSHVSSWFTPNSPLLGQRRSVVRWAHTSGNSVRNN